MNSAVAGKQNNITGGASSITDANLTANRALISDGDGKVGASGVSATELAYVQGAKSSIQAQIDALSVRLEEIVSLPPGYRVKINLGISDLIGYTSTSDGATESFTSTRYGRVYYFDNNELENSIVPSEDFTFIDDSKSLPVNYAINQFGFNPCNSYRSTRYSSGSVYYLAASTLGSTIKQWIRDKLTVESNHTGKVSFTIRIHYISLDSADRPKRFDKYRLDYQLPEVTQINAYQLCETKVTISYSKNNIVSLTFSMSDTDRYSGPEMFDMSPLRGKHMDYKIFPQSFSNFTIETS